MTWSYAEARARSEADRRTLGAEVLRQARRHPRRLAVMDARGAMGYLRLAAVALALRDRFGLAEDETRVGVLLPPGPGGTAVNLALVLDGRTAVNLNHTTGAERLAGMCRQAGLTTIISARRYLERIGEPQLPGRVLAAEDLVPQIGRRGVLRQMLRIALKPPEQLDRARPDDTALVLFSSGTTGEPKGVQLSHRQVFATCDAIMTHLGLVPGVDGVTSPLPLFHMFGLVPGTWLGLVNGCPLAHQADPRDGRALGQLAERSRTTFLISTPTFVQGYLRRIAPEQLRHLRFAVVSAERCPPELQTRFRERYGVDLLEAYGATEIGAVAAQTADSRRPGTVGRPLPGVEILTVHPETGAILPPGEPGVLVVRSAARMQGYLGRPDLTEQAFVHGGYWTGDIGRVDAEGYLTISGRLARFAKMGGEMVPLDEVESRLAAWLAERHGEALALAVGAAPCARRGEKLVVIHTGVPEAPELMLEALADLPPLFRPKPADFHVVPAIPVLGTGKRDLGAIQALVRRLDAAAGADPAEDGVSAVGPGSASEPEGLDR